MSLWRKSVGQTGAGLPADGDGDMDVDQDDYLVWRANFGRTAAAATSANVLISSGSTSTSAIAIAATTSSESSDSVVAAAAREQALFNWPTTAAAAKADKVKGANWLNTVVADSATMNRQLLLAAQSDLTDDSHREVTISSDSERRAEISYVDDIFTELGVYRREVAQADNLLACTLK